MESTYSVGLLSLSGAAVAACVAASTPLGAETLVEQVADTRLVLAFRVDPVELQKVVPGPWDIVGTAAGPAKDANFNVIRLNRNFSQIQNSKSPLLAFLQHPFGCLVGSGVASCTLKGTDASLRPVGAYSGIRRIVG